MKLIKAALVAALAITTIGAVASPAKAAPLPTNIAAMNAALDTSVVQVRYGYGGWHGGWGSRGWGGYRGWGYRGYRGWGLGAGAISSSAYYGGAYPSYGGGYGYGGGYASDYCPPDDYGGYYSGYSVRRYGYGW